MWTFRKASFCSWCLLINCWMHATLSSMAAALSVLHQSSSRRYSRSRLSNTEHTCNVHIHECGADFLINCCQCCMTNCLYCISDLCTYLCATDDDDDKVKPEIWGKAQRQAAWCHKSNCLGPQLLICQAVDYICGKMPHHLKPLNRPRWNLVWIPSR